MKFPLSDQPIHPYNTVAFIFHNQRIDLGFGNAVDISTRNNRRALRRMSVIIERSLHSATPIQRKDAAFDAIVKD